MRINQNSRSKIGQTLYLATGCYVALAWKKKKMWVSAVNMSHALASFQSYSLSSLWEKFLWYLSLFSVKNLWCNFSMLTVHRSYILASFLSATAAWFSRTWDPNATRLIFGTDATFCLLLLQDVSSYKVCLQGKLHAWQNADLHGMVGVPSR